MLPASCRFTVKLGRITLPLKLAVLPDNAKLIVALFAVILLFALILLARILALALKSAALTSAFAVMLAANTLPDTLRLVPVAAPIFGVVNCALVLTTMLPATISVVIPSTFALITVPLIAIPLPAEYEPAAANCEKAMFVIPNTISPVGVVRTYDEPAYALPEVMKK